MTMTELPNLPNGVTYEGPPDGPHESLASDGTTETLWASYRIDDLIVKIGWTVGHALGGFGEPDRLTIYPDLDGYADEHGQGGTEDLPETKIFYGITTSLLRRIPMAHARALMRGRHEELSLTEIKRDLMPLPSRVETDHDYVHVATAYVQLGGTSVEPIKRLSEWTDESPDTWSARLRRARARGILVGTGREAHIAPAYVDESNEIRSALRAMRDAAGGD